MAIDPNTLGVGSQVWLTDDQKEYKAGTPMSVQKVMNLKGQYVVMVHAGGDARAIAVQPQFLTDVDPSGGGTAAVEEAGGPVEDYFANHVPMDEEVTINFLAAYLEANGPFDLTMLEGLLEVNDIPVGDPLTTEQVAKLYSDFSETVGQEVDPVAAAILNPPPPEPPKAAPKAAAKGKAAPKAVEKPAATANTAKAAQAAKDDAQAQPVDRTTWSAVQLDALTLAGAMLPLYAQSPSNFAATVEAAVRIVEAAANEATK